MGYWGQYKQRTVECGPPFRRGTKRKSDPINFVLMNGGIGDFINFTAALTWVAETQKHVDGFVWAHPPMLEVCQHLFKKYRHWKVYDRAQFTKFVVEGSYIIAPNRGTQLLNATGAHLLDLGFNYFAQLDKAPDGWGHLPVIDYMGPWKWPQIKQAGKYAIFTPGATAPARTMPVKAFNELVAYTKSLGVTPVFLGKKVVMGDYVANFEEGYDYTNGIDLREQTSMLEAVQVMRGAEFVIGLDNGLLHFAGTTNVPIIYGHNVTTVEHRKIQRKSGVTIDIYISPQILSCSGCQSKMRFTRHNFNKCIYGDLKCLDILFRDDSREWKSAIDTIMMLKGSNNV